MDPVSSISIAVVRTERERDVLWTLPTDDMILQDLDLTKFGAVYKISSI